MANIFTTPNLFMNKQLLHACGYVLFFALIVLFSWFLYQYIIGVVELEESRVGFFVNR